MFCLNKALDFWQISYYFDFLFGNKILKKHIGTSVYHMLLFKYTPSAT
jgi:hypothetical protein